MQITAATLALLGVASAADVTKAATILGHKGENPENKIKAAKFTAGVLEPFVGSIDPMALMVCVLDIDEVLLTLDTVVHIVEEAIQTKQYPELIVAVLTLGGLVKEVKQAEIPCSQIHPEIDFSKFDRAEKILDHPIQNMKIIEDDVKLNGHSIIEDLKAAVAAYRAGDIEGFGREIGNMLKIASYDEETHKVAESAQGFLEATNVGKINIDALLYCIFDVDNTMIAAYLTGLAIYDAIKDRQPSDLIIRDLHFLFGHNFRPLCEQSIHVKFNVSSDTPQVGLSIISNFPHVIQILPTSLISNLSVTYDSILSSYESFLNMFLQNGHTQSHALKTSPYTYFLSTI